MKCLLFLFIVLSLSISSVYSQHSSRRSFNEGWRFRLDSVSAFEAPSFNDAAWRLLNLPHDWSIEGEFGKDHPAGTGGGALPGGIGWYRKTFTLPSSAKNKEVYIEFDGVYRNAEVFVNGHSLGVRPYGYSSFVHDLTPFVKFGNAANVIAVRVDNLRQPNSRWYSGSGIYRKVWLTVVNKSHIHHSGTFITTPAVSTTKATVRVNTSVSNEDNIPLQLVTTIYSAEGKKLSAITASIQQETSQSVVITNPSLWSIEHPYLYKAVSVLKHGSEILDQYETKFGIRTFSFDRNQGFVLNGNKVKIVGVCMHHDLGALGAAVNKTALKRQLQLLKDMGCNGIRTSHNPPAPELLDLADSMGFVVMDEAFDMWAKAKTPFDYHLDWDQWHKKDLEDFVKRDRNHPSVFMWSVGNEIPEQWGDDKKGGDTSGRAIARELVGLVKALDTTRAIVTANNEINSWNNLLLSGSFDLVGYNYNHQRWGSFLTNWPGKKLIITESTSALETRGYYDLFPADSIRRWPERWDVPFDKGNKDLTVSAYDHVSTPWGSTHEESTKVLLDNDHVSGMYVWTGFDYLGEPTPYSWPARSSYFGIIDLAGFPKDVYYLYKTVFTSKPELHLLPHWNWRAGDTIDVVSYYNHADRVELFLNGRSLGTRSKANGQFHVKWRVPYQPGTLKIVSSINGKQVLSKEVKTAGRPYKILLSPDRKTIASDGEDLSFITATIVDKDGVMVPDAGNDIHISLSGPGTIAGVDSGSPVSLESFKADHHTAMNGKMLCIIQAGKSRGVINLTASANGLQAGSVQLTVK